MVWNWICFNNVSISEVLCRLIQFKLTVKNAASEPGTVQYSARVENGGSLLQALQRLENESNDFRYGIWLCNSLCYANDSKSEDFQCVWTPLICVYVFVIENHVVNYLCTLRSSSFAALWLCCMCSFETTKTSSIAPYLVKVNNVSKVPDTFWDAFLYNEQTKDVIPIRKYKTGEMVTLPKIITYIVFFMFFFFEESIF